MTSTELDRENKTLLSEYLVMKLNTRVNPNLPEGSIIVRIDGYYFNLKNGYICTDSLYSISDFYGYMTMPRYSTGGHTAAVFLQHIKHCKVHNKNGEIIPDGRESELATAPV